MNIENALILSKPVEILLVEDNPGDVRLTQEAFKDSRVTNLTHMSVVSDGEQALNFLHKTNGFETSPQPDLILLDLNLPRLSGREVLKQIRNDAKLSTIPVVILTTSSNDEDILRTYQLNANCYISKPVDLEQFMHVVQSIKDFWVTIVLFPPKE